MNPYIQISEPMFLEAARYQHGPQATLWPNDMNHAYRWNARKPGDNTRYNIDLQAWSRSKYGDDWRTIQIGWDANGWAWFHPYKQEYIVLPVVLVSSDKVWQPAAELNAAGEVFYQNCLRVSEWYAGQVGAGFDVVKPTFFGSNKTSEQWRQIYVDQADRYDTYKAVQSELMTKYQNRMNANVLYVCAQYCGLDSDLDYDAAGGANLTVVSNFACRHQYRPDIADEPAQRVAYAIGHEMGHCLGLAHTDPSLGDASGINMAIMQRGFPPNAILVPYEKDRVKTNPYLRRA